MASDWCDGFLKLVRDGQPVRGECADADFVDAIEIVSFSFGSMQGFTDSAEGLYAAQDANQRRDVAMSRASENPYAGISSLFGEEESGPTEYSDSDLKSYEGKDLADVDACNFQIIKELDVSSPDLFRAYCSTQDLNSREVFESATISLKKATGGGRDVFLTCVFSDVVIVGYSLNIGADALPKETINLSFGKCRMEYKPQAASGELGTAIKGGWDFIDREHW